MSAYGINGPDWLAEFFTPEAEAAMQERRRAEEERRKTIAAILRAEADQSRARAKDWASRQYKGNSRSVYFNGDGPGSEFRSIGGINESRRIRAVDTHNDVAAKLEATADRIEATGDQWLRDAIEHANTTPCHRVGEADMFVGALFGLGNTSGPRSIGGIIRAAYAPPSN